MSHEIQDIKETAEIVYLLNDGVYELYSLNKEIWKKKKKKKRKKLWHCSWVRDIFERFLRELQKYRTRGGSESEHQSVCQLAEIK